jgi:hypothetical protein
MLVPEVLCGDTKTVTASCKRHITRFKRGASWIDAGQMIDARDAPGLIMLNGPSPLLGGAQTRAYGPFWELNNAVLKEKEMFEMSLRAFDEALGQPWSVLGLLSQACYGWLRDAERAGRLIDAMVMHWPELDSVGPRYTRGINTGSSLWELPHLLKYVLANRGVPQPRLVEPLPSGGIRALLGSVN